MRALVLLWVMAVALAFPVAEPEADPQLILPHSLNYFNPFVHSIKAQDSYIPSYPYDHHLPYGHRYPLAYGHGLPFNHGYGTGYPLAYPYSHPYAVQVAKKDVAEE
ncbi:uncharacterized protein [Palaemon carinicauda]|uniref:uncharacterized protein n=1 Tax=Palaemon carinicauda TaxID=392227 RepID=UPI0035B670AE